MELVASPSILLIDQRFCLLGQRDAAALMAALGAAAHDLGLNVILGAEHMQPTIFSALDSVALLDAEGQAAFQGPPSNVLPFLRGLGLMPSAEQAQDIPSFCDAVRAASGMDQELSTPPSSLGSRSSVAELVPDWNQPMQTSANSMTDITCRTGSGQPDAVHGARKAVAAANPGDGHASGLDSGAEPSLHPCCTLEADQPGVAPRGFLGSEGQPALQEARQEQNFQLESATAAVPGDVDQATGSTAIEPATTQAAAPPSPARQCRAVDRETGDAGIRANSHEGVQRSSSGPASSAATSQAASSDPLADWYLPLQPTLPAGRSPAAPCDPVTAQNKDAKTPDSAAGEVYSGSAAAGDAGHKSRDADLPNAQASGMMAAATSKDSLHADVPRTEHTALTAENTGQGLRQAAVGQGRPARPQLSSPPSSVGSPRSSPAQELISDWRAPTRRKAGHSSRRLPQSLAAAALGRNAMPAGAVGVQGDDESSDTSLQARASQQMPLVTAR
ncbi:hypothetical protein WJX72_005001 [[Myrmecia] bisecta]|uniref:Uncharacterized protein n=1 Tax=[Myrmecia] bisecta TaxID=41462 RepID=A0AAW1R6X7_9CHLO